MRRLFEDGRYSDLKVSCGKITWELHKAIVCSQCKFFAAACNSRPKVMSENRSCWTKSDVDQESRTSTIILLDDADAVHAMLQYLYKGTYDDYPDPQENPDSAPGILFNVHVHAIAEKYELRALGREAAANFKTHASKAWKALEFADAIDQIFMTGQDACKDLRDIAVGLAAEHAQDLTTRAFGARFRQVLIEAPAFAAEILSRVVNAEPRPVFDSGEYTCGSCRRRLKHEHLANVVGYTHWKQCHFCGIQCTVEEWNRHKIYLSHERVE